MSNGLYPNPAAYTRQQAQQIIGRIIDEREQSDFPTAYIPGCEWQDPEDGCCLNPGNMTPECTQWTCPLVAAKPLTRHPERLTPEQAEERGKLARRVANGENIPFSLFT